MSCNWSVNDSVSKGWSSIGSGIVDWMSESWGSSIGDYWSLNFDWFDLFDLNFDRLDSWKSIGTIVDGWKSGSYWSSCCGPRRCSAFPWRDVGPGEVTDGVIHRENQHGESP